VGTIGFSNGVLLPATNHRNSECVPHVCGGIVRIEFESLLELSFSSGKIPVVRHLVDTKKRMGASQRRVAKSLKRTVGTARCG
jgi:hypothetical protein